MVDRGGLAGSSFGRSDILKNTIEVLQVKAGRFYHEAHEGVEHLFRELKKAETLADGLLNSNFTAQKQLIEVLEYGGSSFELIHLLWSESQAKRFKLRSSIEVLRVSLAHIIQAK